MAKKAVVKSGTYVFFKSRFYPQGTILQFDRWDDPTDGNDLSFWTKTRSFIHPTMLRIVSVTRVVAGKKYMLILPVGEFPEGAVFVAKETQNTTVVYLKLLKGSAMVSFPINALMELVCDSNDPFARPQLVFAAKGELMDITSRLRSYQENNENYSQLKRIENLCVQYPELMEDEKVFSILESGLFSIAFSPNGRHKMVKKSTLCAVELLGKFGNAETERKLNEGRNQKISVHLDEALIAAINAIHARIRKQ